MTDVQRKKLNEMKINKWIILSLWILTAVFIQPSCSEFDEYKKYVPDGEIIYPAKVDSVKTFSGKNRIMLSWINTDPRIVKYRISWNLGNDSVWIDAGGNAGASKPDTIRTIIADMEEADYEFSIVSCDDDNNQSVKTFVAGKVYGENYKNTLLNRGIFNSSALVGTNSAEIEWFEPDLDEVGVEVIYTDTNDQEVSFFMSRDKTLTKLADYKEGTEFQYRTLYLPELDALDTFYTEYVVVEAPELTYPRLDKSKFDVFVLPGDAPDAWGWVMPNLWDGDTNSGFHTASVGFPLHFTFDLGVQSSLHEVRVWQRMGGDQVYQRGNMKKFEIWGSNEPAPDGSFDGWTKLLDCESVKPSGSDGITDEDIAYAGVGELFAFPAETPAVRYIRFKVLEPWWPEMDYVNVMEVSFWGVF